MPYECNLSPELQKYAKDVLNEDPATRDEKIEDVREWINKQPHLNARTDDIFILRFLRTCKFDLEKTKQRIDDYYTIRSMIPEWFKNRDPNEKDLRAIFEMGGVLPIPQLDKNGKRVFLLRLPLVDPTKISVNEMMKAFHLFLDVYLEDDEVGSIMGVKFIEDMEGLSAAHFLAFTPPLAKRSITFVQEGSTFRIQAIHYINARSEFERLYNMFKVFLNEEMTNILTIHGSDYTPIFEEIPQEILTKEYGGKEETQALIDYCLKKMDEKRDWILEQEKYGVDESKRPGKPKTAGDLFGIDESIKELSVD